MVRVLLGIAFFGCLLAASFSSSREDTNVLYPADLSPISEDRRDNEKTPSKPQKDSGPTQGKGIIMMLISIVIMLVGGFGSDYLRQIGPSAPMALLGLCFSIGGLIGFIGMLTFLAGLARGK